MHHRGNSSMCASQTQVAPEYRGYIKGNIWPTWYLTYDEVNHQYALTLPYTSYVLSLEVPLYTQYG